MDRKHGQRTAAAQAGLTLLEVILSLAILASVTVGLNQLADRFADDTRNTVAAGQVRTFGEAARSYIRDNYAAVQAVATATAPALIDLPTLIAAGKLPAGFQGLNAFGQSTCALVFEPVANRLQAMVIAEGGSAIGDPSLGNVAAVVGGSGGGVYASDPSQIRGAVGGWSLATAGFDNKANHLGRRCDGTAGNVRLAAGHPAMALWFENGDTSSAFVARDAVPGRPELNAMNTPLVMNAVQALDGACTQAGAIAQDGSGGILSCQSGAWKPVGDGKCVPTTADLNTLQTDGRCFNGANLPNSPAGGRWVFVEVFRHFDRGDFFVAQRAVGMDGAALGKIWLRTQNSLVQSGGWSPWVQIADPGVAISDGNVAAANSVNTVSLNARGNVAADENVVARKNVTGAFLFSSGSIQASEDVVSLRNAVNQNGSTYNIGDDWSFVGLAAGSRPNVEPGLPRGSLQVNDVFLRSIGKWASELGATGMSRTSPRFADFTTDADYRWVTVTISAKYMPFDGQHKASSDWALQINGAVMATVHDDVNVIKAGASGHYWGYDSFGVEQKQFNIFVPRNSRVQVVPMGSAFLLDADVRVDLAP